MERRAVKGGTFIKEKEKKNIMSSVVSKVFSQKLSKKFEKMS